MNQRISISLEVSQILKTKREIKTNTVTRKGVQSFIINYNKRPLDVRTAI